MEKDIFNIFDSEQDFWNIKRDPGYEKSTISVVDGSETHIGELLFFGNESAQAGDILVVDKNGKKMYTDPVSYRTLKEDGEIGDNGYTPIGVCAIPVGLTVNLGNQGVNKGKSRVVSLANMSLKTPDTGTLRRGRVDGDNNMYWGDNTKILGNTDDGPVFSKNPYTGVEKNTDWVRLPTTSYLLGTNYFGNIDKTDDHYPIRYYPGDGEDRFGVSPYGEYSEKYFQGYLGNLKGKENCDLIMSKVTAPWQEGEIENSYAAGHCPTVCACRRYHTKGTQAGDWYLPTIGELGIMWARMKEINDSLDLIGEGYAIKVGTLKEYWEANNSWDTFGLWLWSSLEVGSTHSKLLGCSDGHADWLYKYYLVSGGSRVRAFLAF